MVYHLVKSSADFLFGLIGHIKIINQLIDRNILPHKDGISSVLGITYLGYHSNRLKQNAGLLKCISDTTTMLFEFI